jgi:N-acetylglucosaminyl-diphospho-decaprenol L-rhamnosyltransferase
VTPTIDVVVPVYGNWPLTASCLTTLAAQSVAHRVIVVDDKSPDDTLQRLAADFPKVDIVEMPRNGGFASACNAGIDHGNGDIVVLVNNDVEADPRMLEHLVAPFSDSQVGSAAPLLLTPNGSIDALGIVADVTMAGFVRLHGLPETALNGTLPRLVGPYGAVAAYRRSALEDVGFLDEGIFMYGEELDLALRLGAAGWTSAAATQSRGIHLGGATSGRGSSRQRQRAGFGRGYLLRAYGVLTSRHAVRAVVTEFIVCVGDALLNHDLAATRGRLAGWRAGGSTFRRSRAIPAIDPNVSFVKSLQMRMGAR